MNWAQMAVLYRTNSQSALIEEEFMRRRIPYSLTHGQRLYWRREVRDLLAYLAVAEGGDEMGLTEIVNTPPRGLGPVTVRAIKGMHPSITWNALFDAMTRGAEMKLRPQAVEAVSKLYDLLMALEAKCKEMNPADSIDAILDLTGYEQWLAEDLDGEARLASIRELQREAAEHDSITAFLAAVKEKTAAGVEQPDESGVALGTIHSVKGRQFTAVFVIGMEEGLLPHVKSTNRLAEEGERRLAYVAMTRAQDHLYLVSVQSREYGGRRVNMRPSRYLGRLPREHIVRRQ